MTTDTAEGAGKRVEDGGPAFARERCAAGNRSDSAAGMSMRDYFAAAALTGHIAAVNDLTDERRARRAYELADAMLRARSEGGK